MAFKRAKGRTRARANFEAGVGRGGLERIMAEESRSDGRRERWRNWGAARALCVEGRLEHGVFPGHALNPVFSDSNYGLGRSSLDVSSVTALETSENRTRSCSRRAPVPNVPSTRRS